MSTDTDFRDLKLVEIYWLDTTACSKEWDYKDDAVKEMSEGSLTCRAMGYVSYEDDVRLCLTAIESSGCFRSSIVVPKVCIVSRWELIRKTDVRL